MKTTVHRSLAWIAVLTCALVPAVNAHVDLKATLANPLIFANGTTRTYLKVELRGGSVAPSHRRPAANVALVIDCSGSMTGEKIAKAREAAIMAVARLGERDIVSVVTYNETVRVIVPATRLTDREQVLAGLRQIQADGNTALFAGVSKGAAEVRKFLQQDRVNRVILLSDGLANVGPSSPGALGELGRSLGREGISVTTIGLGSDYNEDLMVNLAQASDGNHSFARSADDLIAIFDREFSDVLSVVAQDLGIHIRCHENVRPVRAIGREADVRGQDIQIGLNQLYGEQEKYAVIEIDIRGPGEEATVDVAAVDVRYFDAIRGSQQSASAQVRARATTSRQKVKETMDRETMVSAVTQVANDMNVQAMKLKDAGDTQQAQQTLRENAQYIREANRVLQSEQLEELEGWNLQDAQAVDDEDWGKKGRKVMRERQHHLQNQQLTTPGE